MFSFVKEVLLSTFDKRKLAPSIYSRRWGAITTIVLTLPRIALECSSSPTTNTAKFKSREGEPSPTYAATSRCQQRETYYLPSAIPRHWQRSSEGCKAVINNDPTTPVHDRLRLVTFRLVYGTVNHIVVYLLVRSAFAIDILGLKSGGTLFSSLWFSTKQAKVELGFTDLGTTALVCPMPCSEKWISGRLLNSVDSSKSKAGLPKRVLELYPDEVERKTSRFGEAVVLSLESKRISL